MSGSAAALSEHLQDLQQQLDSKLSELESLRVALQSQHAAHRHTSKKREEERRALMKQLRDLEVLQERENDLLKKYIEVHQPKMHKLEEEQLKLRKQLKTSEEKCLIFDTVQ